MFIAGKVFVHCFQGISRSATLVIVYLMMYRKFTVEQAIKKIRKKRPVFPNDGFLKQLCELNEQLVKERMEKGENAESNSGMVDQVEGEEVSDKDDSEVGCCGAKD